jgi:hypothetical protein
MSKVTLYSTKRRIDLTLHGDAVPNWNYPMQTPDFRAYKGATTDVEFIVRNVDRKPVPLTDVMLVLNVLDIQSRQVLFQLPLITLDAQRALARVTLLPEHLMLLDTGFYAFSVARSDGRLLYVDQYDQARGFFEVMDGAAPVAKPTLAIPRTAFRPYRERDIDQLGFVSGAYSAANIHGLHTFAVYTDRFDGKFWVQGSLEQDPPEYDYGWFNLPLRGELTHMFHRVSGVTCFNVEAKLNWIRFRFEQDLLNHGEVTQVLLRN